MADAAAATGIRTAYRTMVEAGELRADPDQAAAAEKLYALRVALDDDHRPGLFGRLFGAKPAAPRGRYRWGGVGGGKWLRVGRVLAPAPRAASTCGVESGAASRC